MLEKDIESKLRKSIKPLGARCLKFVSPGFLGVPDRIILIPGGKVIFAELKQLGKKERPRQEYVQGILRGLGFDVFSSVNTQEKLEAVVSRCKELMG